MNVLPDTDRDAADWISRHCDGNLTYTTPMRGQGDWYWWSGVRHEVVDQRKPLELIGDLIDHLDLEIAKQAVISDKIKAAQSYLRRLKSASGEAQLLNRLKNHVAVAGDHFIKKQPRYVAMSNGYVLDLADLHHDPLPPDKSKPITRTLGVTLDEHVTAPTRFLEWLDTVLPNKEEQDLLKESAGAALLGMGEAKIIVHLVGGPNTGKSTYFRIMQSVFGSYAGSLPPNAIVQKYGGGTNFDQYRAQGIRFLHLSEPATDRTDDGFLKSLAGGGDPINSQRKGRDNEEWYAECVFHVAANSIVKFNTKDRAIVDRMAIVEFNHHVPNKDVDTDFHRKLIDDEGAGILMWVLEGARRYQQWGHVKIPDSVKGRGLDHVVESSSALRWLRFALDSGDYVLDVDAPMSKMATRKATYISYVSWCAEEGEKALANRAWHEEIEKANGAPADKRNSRAGGNARVFGLRRPTEQETTAQVSSAVEHVLIDDL